MVATQAVHSSEGTAAVVTLRNTSPHALRDVPIAITVKSAHGATLYQNNAPGLEAALTSVPLLAAGADATWIDDQVQTNEAPASVSAVVGEAPPASGPIPQITLTGVHANEEGGSSGIAGTVHNDSATAQREPRRLRPRPPRRAGRRRRPRRIERSTAPTARRPSRCC